MSKNKSFNGRDLAFPVFYAHEPRKNRALHVEFLAVKKNRRRRRTEPFIITYTESQTQPVRAVDKVFIVDRATGNMRRDPVIDAGHVRSGIMNF